MGFEEKEKEKKEIVKRSRNPEIDNLKREVRNETVEKPGDRGSQKRKLNVKRSRNPEVADFKRERR